MNNENVKILTMKEVATLLKISISKAYSLVKENNFPVIRIGKSVRVLENELFDWLNVS